MHESATEGLRQHDSDDDSRASVVCDLAIDPVAIASFDSDEEF